MWTIREKYRNDPVFYRLVNCMVGYIDKCQYTPSEMREAAILASIIYTNRHPPDIRLPATEDALKVLESFVCERPNGDSNTKD